jgi:hypothetical protein
LFIISGVSSGHKVTLLVFIPFTNVDFTGEKHAAWRYCASSMCVCFFRMIIDNDGFSLKNLPGRILLDRL